MRSLRKRTRRTSITALTLAAGIVAAGLGSGCGVFRSTKMGYFNSPQKDQVRQGETVQVAVFRVDKEDASGSPEIAAIGAALAAVALEKAIDFASTELQKHLEKVAALHEASYEGKVIIPMFNPRHRYDIHIVRSVSKSEADRTTAQECARSIYRLSPTPLKNGHVAVVVEYQDNPTEYSEKSEVKRAAARLADARQSFQFDTSLSFYTAADAQNDGTTTAEAPGAATKPARPVRQQIGQTMVHRRMINLEGMPAVSPLTITPADGQPVNRVAEGALGFLVVAGDVQMLEIDISVTEKDPSRAAERNRAVQQNLKDLTPQFIEYVKDRAGLKGDDAAK